MKYFPESETDCSALEGPNANTCRSNLSLFNALKSNDPKLCPGGKAGIACLSFFSRSVQEPCAKYMNKLSTDFCSGGKYAKTRKVSLRALSGDPNGLQDMNIKPSPDAENYNKNNESNKYSLMKDHK